MDFFEIISVLAIAVSLIVAFLEIWPRFRKLQLRVLGYEVLNKGNYSIVLFRICLVNPSSSGKTVYCIRNTEPPPLRIMEAPYQYKVSDGIVIYPLTIDIEDAHQTQSLQHQSIDILQYPLDILPNQSAAKWMGLLVQWESQADDKHISIPFSLCAENVDGKKMAETEIVLSLSKLCNNGFYPNKLHYSRKKG